MCQPLISTIQMREFICIWSFIENGTNDDSVSQVGHREIEMLKIC